MSESCHIWVSPVTREWVKSHTSHIWVSHVAYEWVMSHMSESCHIWLVIRGVEESLWSSVEVVEDAGTWVSHVTHEWVMSHMSEPCHIWVSHVTYEWVMSHMTRYNRIGKFSTNLSLSGRIRQVQNTTSCHNSGTMNLNSIRISTVRGHAPYKYPPRSTMPMSLDKNTNKIRISWSDTSFSPTGV